MNKCRQAVGVARSIREQLSRSWNFPAVSFWKPENIFDLYLFKEYVQKKKKNQPQPQFFLADSWMCDKEHDSL